MKYPFSLCLDMFKDVKSVGMDMPLNASLSSWLVSRDMLIFDLFLLTVGLTHMD